MRLSPSMGIYVVLGIAAVAIGVSQFEKSQKAERAKFAFLSDCEQEYEADWCRAQASIHHEPCFQRNYRKQISGQRYAPETHIFYRDQYHDCLVEGFDKWNAALVAKNRDDRAFVQEHLN